MISDGPRGNQTALNVPRQEIGDLLAPADYYTSNTKIRVMYGRSRFKKFD